MLLPTAKEAEFRKGFPAAHEQVLGDAASKPKSDHHLGDETGCVSSHRWFDPIVFKEIEGFANFGAPLRKRLFYL
jgi:hypothetical protein